MIGIVFLLSLATGTLAGMVIEAVFRPLTRRYDREFDQSQEAVDRARSFTQEPK